MKRLSVLTVVLLLAATADAQSKEGKFRKSERRLPNQYIVLLNEDAGDVRGLAAALARSHAGIVDYVYTRAVKGFSLVTTEGMARRLAEHPAVAAVEEDGEVSENATQTNAPWGLDRIDQRDLPLSTTFTYTRTGAGVRAYIIDTGIRRTHAEFGGRAVHGFSAINDGRGSTDCNGHGTAVAGVVGGRTFGVAKGVTLVAVRVLSCSGSGAISGVIAGIDWVRNDHASGAPAVANMSLGGPASAALDTAVSNAISDGVTFTVSAGASNSNACNYSPARVPAGITVGASTNADARTSFSNFGSCVDLFAPGMSIPTAWSTSDTATTTLSGTSMAAAHTAGVAALFLHGSPAASPSAARNALVNNATTNRLANIGAGSPNRLLFTNY
jgi:subtilisin family serine protease